mmetsp:Transcript_11253/g.35735  ORF Transcript_11253/g.35735 Transcript_11253/m.35735 type:complete len:479 (+) Transcript_11253:161-1597(+)
MGVCASSGQHGGQAKPCSCTTKRCFNTKEPIRELSVNHDLEERFPGVDELPAESACRPLRVQSVFDSPRGETPQASRDRQQAPQASGFNRAEVMARIPPFAWYAGFITCPLLVLVTMLVVHSAMSTVATTTTTTTVTTTDTTTTSSTLLSTFTRTPSTTTTYTVTTATTTSTLSTVSLEMTFHHLDYSGLMGQRQLCHDFEAGMQEVIASEAGHGIRASHVELTLVAGSVEVKARIFQLPSAVADAARTRLVHSRRLSERLIKTVSNIEGIDSLSTGLITISGMQVWSSNLPGLEVQGIDAPAAEFEVTSNILMLLGLFVAFLGLVLLVVCCTVCRTFSQRGYSKMPGPGRATSPAAPPAASGNAQAQDRPVRTADLAAPREASGHARVRSGHSHRRLDKDARPAEGPAGARAESHSISMGTPGPGQDPPDSTRPPWSSPKAFAAPIVASEATGESWISGFSELELQGAEPTETLPGT